MCMRAGLYQTKKDLLVFFGIVAVKEVDDLGGDFLGVEAAATVAKCTSHFSCRSCSEAALKAPEAKRRPSSAIR